MNRFYYYIVFLLFLIGNKVVIQAQQDVRYIFKNTSNINELQFADDELYIAVIGRNDEKLGKDIIGFLDDINTTDPSLIRMSTTYNTLQGPNGGQYGDIFEKVSDLPANGAGEHYIDIPPMEGGQIWIGIGSPMYVALGNGAYAGPDISNPTNPNFNGKFEIIEFTNRDDINRIISNTTRVDVYQYPMGQEVYGPGGQYEKVGETVTHEQVIAKWKLFVADPFLACLDEEKGLIHQPTKIPEFQTGGAYDNYFGDFVDQMWDKYRTQTLQAQWGGVVHTATVQGNDLVWNNGDRIPKPTTAQIVGGDDPLRLGNGQILGVCINRGVVDLNNNGVQVWDDESNYYKTVPKNDYTHFFHSDLVSFDSKTYAFAYDDVFDHSSTVTMDNPEKVVISIGGFGIEHVQQLTDIYIDPLQTEIDEFQTFQFVVKGLDQAQIDMDLPNDAVITWSVNGGTAPIDQTGLFGPADIGTYSVQVTVELNGNTFTAQSTIKVNKEGTSGQVCVGDLNEYATYRIEPRNNRVYITFIPKPGQDVGNNGQLFFDKANGSESSLPFTINQEIEMYGVFLGGSTRFRYTHVGGGFNRDTPWITIPNIGTCEGLEVEERITRIEINEQDVELEVGQNINLTVTGFTNKGNQNAIDNGITWSGEGVDANGIFTATEAGTFVITANYNGYSHQTTIIVTNGCQVQTIDLGGDLSVCENESLTLAISGGPYDSLNWSGSGSNLLNDLTIPDPDFTAATEGNYELFLEAFDANGCKHEGQKNITVNPTPNTSIASVNPVCLNSDPITLEALVDLPNGFGSWNGATKITETTASFSPNQTGTVTVSYIFESNEGCSSNEAFVEIEVKDLPEVSLNESSVCASVDNNDLSLLMNPSGVPAGGSGIFVNASGGTLTQDGSFTHNGIEDRYEITYEYTDLNGCSNEAIANFIVNANLVPIITSDKDFELCKGEEAIFGLNNGDLVSQTWSGSASNFIQNDLSSENPQFSAQEVGSFQLDVEIEDESGCMGSGSINVTVNDLPNNPSVQSVTISQDQVVDQASVPELCAAGSEHKWYLTNDGNGVVQASTSCFSVPFTDVSPQDGKMDVGIYSMYVSQTINGCESELSEVQLTVEETVITDCPVPAPQVTNYEICEGNTIQLSAISSGGDLGWWKQNPGEAVLGDEEYFGNEWIDHNFVEAGSYDIFVSEYDETNDCYGPPAIINLQIFMNPTVKIENPVQECGSSIIYLQSAVSNNNGSVNYEWSSNTGSLSDDDVANTSITLDDEATVQLSIIDEKGCVASTSKDIQILTSNVTEINQNDTSICAGDNVVLNAEVEPAAQVEITWYYSSNGDSFSEITSGREINIINGGFYYATTGLDDCSIPSDTIQINTKNISLDATSSKDRVLPGEIFSLIATSSSDNITYSWLLPDGSNQGGSEIETSIQESSLFKVIASDEFCEVETDVFVTVSEPLKIPNGFSPNDDGKNDEWLIKGIEEFKNARVIIYNRWGGKVYEYSNGYDMPWTGINMQGNKLPVGTYYYVINPNGNDEMEVSGFVSILVE